MTDTVADRVGALSRRLEQGDFDAIRGFLARDYYSHSPGTDEAGAAERIADLAAGFKAGLPDLTATISDIRVDGGTCSAVLNVAGTHTDELWNAPGSGNRVEWITPISIRPVGDRLAMRIDETTTPDRVGLLRQLRLVNPADEMDLPPHYPHMAPEFLLKLVLTGAAGDKPCSHFGLVEVTEPTTFECEQCVASGDIWPALRMCLICGFVGCCDTAKGRHMAAHHQETGHPIFRSINADEGWIWCYDDDAFLESSTLERLRRAL
jgi:hypothetical protein